MVLLSLSHRSPVLMRVAIRPVPEAVDHHSEYVLLIAADA